MARAALWSGALLFLLLHAACDLRVDAGRTTVLANGGTVLAVNTPNAVHVAAGGTLIVQDADVLGLGRAVEQGDALRPPGDAIVASGGIVRAFKGTISGGNVLVVAPDPATPAQPSAPQVFPPMVGSALVARDSSVEIDGATLVASGVLGAVPFVPAPALSAIGGDVRIRSGALRLGPGTESSPFFLALVTLHSLESRIEISGGEFVGGRLLLTGSRTRITGGNLGVISLGIDVALLNPMPLPRAGCAELRGGSVQLISVDGPAETLFIFGSQFNLPFGPLPVPQLAMRVFGAPPTAHLTGRLEDGSPLDVQISVFDAAARVFLAAPGMAGCPN